jgi:hypothetical protein
VRRTGAASAGGRYRCRCDDAVLLLRAREDLVRATNCVAAEPARRRRANFLRSDGGVFPMCRRLVGSAKDSGGWAVTRTGFTTCDRNCCVMHGVMSLAHNSIVPKGKGMHDLGPWATECMHSCAPTHARVHVVQCLLYSVHNSGACMWSVPSRRLHVRALLLDSLFIAAVPWLNISSTPILRA